MDNLLKNKLFEKNYLVADSKKTVSGSFETVYALRSLLGIRVTGGEELAEPGIIEYASKIIGVSVPAAFYKGFPQSVRALTADERLFDQFVHYTITYGFGRFEQTGHSVMEEYEGRSEFRKKTKDKCMEIVDEARAREILEAIIENLLSSTRPLSDGNLELICCYAKEYDYRIPCCASKNTAVRLIKELRSSEPAQFIMLSDVIKLVDELDKVGKFGHSLHELNLKNCDRKLIKEVMDTVFLSGRVDIINCYEKKAVWCGLLHHIHYKPINEQAEYFVNGMRGNDNKSVYSEFEKAMGEGRINEAVDILRKGKGETALLRKLEYILSRCKDDNEVQRIIDSIVSNNGIVLLQLYMKYRMYDEKKKPRTFTYTHSNMLKVYTEKTSKMNRRRSFLDKDITEVICAKVEENIKTHFAQKQNRVYISEDMKNITLPISENASSSGFGVFPKGSRLHIPEGKKIRAFTYWEKVDDIDLSVMGLKEDGGIREFSWRTMAAAADDCIVFSGDQTSGYNGGSEYFDIDIQLFREKHPDIEYLVFSDNVYSGKMFSSCVCSAGYMLRDMEDSGEIFEPKTVQTSFAVNCDSRFAYLFAIELKACDFIWLNINRDSTAAVAGTTSFDFIRKYFDFSKIINMYDFFTLCAKEVVDSPQKADVIVSDEVFELTEGQTQIHSFDTDVIIKCMQ